MKITILHAALFTPSSYGWGLPLLVEDQPGVGKTSVIETYAARCGFLCEVLSPGERGEGAFGAVPVPVKGALTYPMPEWAVEMNDAGAGVVLVDEVTSAGPALQAPCLGLVGSKRIGGGRLAPRVRVIGACNPPDVAAHGHDLAPPLANRFGHLEWGAPSVDEHAAYMLGQGVEASRIDAVAEEARVMAAWPEAYAKAAGLETAFLRAMPHLKNVFPKDGNAGRAWPSDRTWEYATRALAASFVHGLSPQDTDAYVSAFIGSAAFNAFAAFIESADLPDPAALLDGKIKFSHNPERLDRSAAVIGACTALVVPAAAANRMPRAEALWKLLGQVGDAHLDLIIPPIQAMLTTGDLHTIPAGVPVLAKVQPTIAAANAARR